MERDDRILITGGSGLVGTALSNILVKKGFTNILALSRKDCDLLNTDDTERLFRDYRPDFVFHLAAAVFGIMGNMENKGRSFFENEMINLNVIEAANRAKIKKFLGMGSGCVYPYPPPEIPLQESSLWKGEPHTSEDSYAHAKRAMFAQLNAYKESYGLKSAFVISCNLFGPNDKFDANWGHVVPSLVKKFHDAAQNGSNVVVWGDGSAQRDFLFSEDAANALLMIMDNLDGPVNIGSGEVHSIKEIVEILGRLSGLENRIDWDHSKPNGQEYRAYDLQKITNAGFKPQVSFVDGITKTYRWYEQNHRKARV